MYFESVYLPEKYMLRVYFESPFMRMIFTPKYKWPPWLTRFMQGVNCGHVNVKWLSIGAVMKMCQDEA